MTNIPPPGPLAYEGTVAVPFINRPVGPTTSNYQFNVPTIWINTVTDEAWLLVSKPMNVANWVLIGFNVGSVFTLTGNSGGPISPDVNGNIDTLGSGSITIAGSGNTLTTELTGLTNHAVLVGAGTTTITKVGASATVGAAFISAGASADPRYSTNFSVLDATVSTLLSGARVGANVTMEVTNSDNTNSASNAVVYILTGGSSGGNPFQIFSTTATNYAMGINNAISDQFEIRASSAVLGAGQGIIVETSGLTTVTNELNVGTQTPTNQVNLNVQGANAGGVVEVEIRNTDNTNSASKAVLGLVTGGTSSGDPYVTYNIPSGGSWSHGIDNSVSNDPFIVSASSALGTTDVMRMTTAGQVTKPLQPAFNQSNGTNRTNATGDGTAFTLIFNVAESTQQGSGFDGTSTFTAPVTGWYHFDLGCYLTGIAAQDNTYITITHTGIRTYFGDIINAGVVASSGALALSMSRTFKMTANDTVTCTVVSSGSTKTVTVDNTAVITSFQGYLVC